MYKRQVQIRTIFHNVCIPHVRLPIRERAITDIWSAAQQTRNGIIPGELFDEWLRDPLEFLRIPRDQATVEDNVDKLTTGQDVDKESPPKVHSTKRESTVQAMRMLPDFPKDFDFLRRKALGDLALLVSGSRTV